MAGTSKLPHLVILTNSIEKLRLVIESKPSLRCSPRDALPQVHITPTLALTHLVLVHVVRWPCRDHHHYDYQCCTCGCGEHIDHSHSVAGGRRYEPLLARHVAVGGGGPTGDAEVNDDHMHSRRTQRTFMDPRPSYLAYTWSSSDVCLDQAMLETRPTPRSARDRRSNARDDGMGSHPDPGVSARIPHLPVAGKGAGPLRRIRTPI